MEVNGNDQERSTWREREKQRAREEILEAAAHVFAQSGYDRAGMKEIASRAGISVGMLYNHFEGKEYIFRALLERYVTAFTRGATAAAGRSILLSRRSDAGYGRRSSSTGRTGI